MDDDQQFCLRWNNHQSTLISVIDTLLENGTLVDCTLAAEGKFLKAHKVVLSACSPYFATLLSQQYDKHPIFILKDVKFQELRAMMDYMYRGEVNISQDQLAALLKAAESLQIKGLSDNRSSSSAGTGGGAQKGDATAVKSLQPPVPASKASGLTIENKRSLKSELHESDMSGSREGSSSPTSRKRKKVRRRSVDTNNLLIDNHDQHSNSSSHSMHTGSGANVAALAVTGTTAANVAASSLSSSSSTAAAGSNSSANVLSVAAVAAAAALKKTETVQQAAAETLKLQKQQQQAAAAAAAAAQSSDDDERCGGPGSVATGTEHDDGNDLSDNEHDGDGGSSVKSGSRHHHLRDGSRRGKMSTSSMGEMMIEPKSEYEDVQDENVEDLTMDDEDLMDELDQPGPSHGGDVSSQGYAQWPMEREQNEAFIAAQDAVGGQHRDAQDALAGMMLSAYNRHRDSSSLSEEPIPMAPAEVLLLSLSTSPVPSVAQQQLQPHQQQQHQQHLLSAEGVDSSGSFSVSASSSSAHTDGQCGKQPGHDWMCSKEVAGRDRALDPLRIRAIMPNRGKSGLLASARNEYSISSSSMKNDEISLVRQPPPGGRSSLLATSRGGLLRNERESRGSARIATSGRITVASGLLLQPSLQSSAASDCSTASGKRFRCDYCPFSCSWRYDLKLHLKQKHGIHKKNV
uniref:BTB domain-containing protein n=1 Tax=Anopheles funestus TaxID=62324 RepID=A0A4Y0BJF1_ANOFN